MLINVTFGKQYGRELVAEATNLEERGSKESGNIDFLRGKGCQRLNLSPVAN